MTIEIKSAGDALVLVLSGIAVLGVVATVHWTMFAAPLLKKMLEPLNTRISVTSRVVQEQFPREYKHAEEIAHADSRLWGKA